MRTAAAAIRLSSAFRPSCPMCAYILSGRIGDYGPDCPPCHDSWDCPGRMVCVALHNSPVIARRVGPRSTAGYEFWNAVAKLRRALRPL